MKTRYLIAVLLGITIVSFLAVSPLIFTVLGIDQGNFVYIASQILHGAIPYRDIWDQKAPLIYYIDAIGLLLGNGSVWGIWIMEVVFASFTALICFTTLKKFISVPAAFLATLSFLILFLTFLSMGGGNITEEYVVSIQFLSIFVFLAFQEKKKLLPFLLGVFFTVIFLTKQNYGGIDILLLFFLVYSAKSFRQKVISLLIFVVPDILILGLVVLYFLSHHALADFWNDVIVYNIAYSSTPILQYGKAILNNVILLIIMSPIFFMAIWIWIVSSLLFLRRKILVNKKNLLLLIAVCDFSLEFLAGNISARPYRHYFIPMIPSATILLVYAYEYLLVRKISGPLFSKIPIFSRRLFFQIILTVLVVQIGIACYFFYFNYRVSQEDYRFLKTIPSLSFPSVQFLQWGGEGGIYFFFNKKSPTKYASLFPLFTKNFQNDTMANTLFSYLKKERPKFVIDTSANNIAAEKRDSEISLEASHYEVTPKISQVILYIRHNYHLIVWNKTIRWSMYEINK